MKIVLIQDSPGLGNIGQIKDVSPGYARNFLLPRGLAVLPSDPKAKEMAKEKLSRGVASKKAKTKTETKLAHLNGQTFVFKVKTDKKGHLYASIGPKEIAEKIDVDEPLIKEHFKELGTFPLEIKIDPENTAKINIVVEKEK